MITPMDIHNKTFSRQLRGFSAEEVNSFLEELAGDYEKIYREHREMEEEIDAIRTKLRGYEKMEQTMSGTLIMAQETADNVKRNAVKEAELSMKEAHAEAKKIMIQAEEKRRRINEELLKTEGSMNLYLEKLMSNFKTAYALIEAAKSVKAPSPIEEIKREEATPASAAAPAAEEKPAEKQEENAEGDLFASAAADIKAASQKE